MIRRTLSLTRKELTHIVRDPRTLVIMIVIPLVMLIVLGYAGTTDVDHLRTAVYDGDKTMYSRELIKAYEIPAAVLNDVRVASLRPKMMIKPKLDPDLKPEDFNRLDDAIESGYSSAVEVLDALDLEE